MRFAALLILACVPSLTCYSQPVDKAGEKYSAEDMQALHKVAEQWERFWNSHDMVSFATLFANDVDFVTKSGNWFKGKEATMNHHRQNHATIFKNSTWTIDSVTMKYVKPDVAIIHVGWGISGDSFHDGTPSSPRHGMSTWVAVKQNKEWLLLAVQNANIVTPR